MAVYDLRLTPEQFFEMTPRQLNALMKRQELARIESEFMLAQLTAHVINFSVNHPKERVQTRDLMPSQWAQNKVVESREKVALDLRSIMETGPWTVKKADG